MHSNYFVSGDWWLIPQILVIPQNHCRALQNLALWREWAQLFEDRSHRLHQGWKQFSHIVNINYTYVLSVGDTVSFHSTWKCIKIFMHSNA